MEAEQSNFDWLLEAIAKAMTTERLDLLGCEIKIDTEAGVDYTADPSQMDMIRQDWKTRYILLRSLENERIQQQSKRCPVPQREQSEGHGPGLQGELRDQRQPVLAKLVAEPGQERKDVYEAEIYS